MKAVFKKAAEKLSENKGPPYTYLINGCIHKCRFVKNLS